MAEGENPASPTPGALAAGRQARLLAAQRALGPLLWPLGALYAGGMALRRGLYAAGLFSSWQPPAPCISVGNIAMGGSGKTPLTSWLLSWACAKGLRPAALTRGYRAAPPSLPYLVTPQSPPQHAGDEPLMLAQRCPAALVAVDPSRSRAGRWLAESHGPDLYVLDDGFQHLAVRRNLDLVLLRPADLGDDWGRVFPAGYWREGAGALKNASAFLIKAPAEQWPALWPAIQSRLTGFGRPVFPFSLRPAGLRRVVDGAAATLPQGPYLLVAGVAHPDQVTTTAQGLMGHGPARVLAYEDHYTFEASDLNHFRRMASQLGCVAIVCTPKDGVKLRPLLAGQGPRQAQPATPAARQKSAPPPTPDDPAILTFALDLDFGPGVFTAARFPEYLDGWWATARKGQPSGA